MSKHVKHVPKHRAAPVRPALADAPRRAVRTTVVLSSVAVAATGATISGGLLASPANVTNAATDVAPNAISDLRTPTVGSDSSEGSTDREPVERAQTVSRSDDRRDVADPVKEAALSAGNGRAMTQTESLSDEDPREIGRALLGEFGFAADQFGCLDSLWTRESNWTYNADNPTSSAYGIPQSLPGSKMASAGADWETNPVTQIRWGLGYIADSYGTPCGAWAHSESVGWY